MSEHRRIDYGQVGSGRAYGGRPDREKRYVDVVSLTTADGLVTPLEIHWDDGRRFHIDKVLDRRQAHSLKTGGTGMRYSVRVAGHDTYLWYDVYRRRWFVEAKRMTDASDWGYDQSAPTVARRPASSASRSSSKGSSRASSSTSVTIESACSSARQPHALPPEGVHAPHSGFDRDRIDDWLNLFSVIVNPPRNRLEKTAMVLDRAMAIPISLPYREFYGQTPSSE